MDILTCKHVITRKEHNCWGCRRLFPKGSLLKFVTAVDQGDFGSVYWCSVCDEILSKRGLYEDVNGDGYDYGEVIDYFEDWEKVREEIEGI